MAKFEAGVIVTLVLAAVAGLIWVGEIQGTVNTLSTQSIAKARDEAIADIEAAKVKSGSQDSTIPSGMVVFFDLPSCPVGWIAEDHVRGRYVVGINAPGELGAKVGVRLETRRIEPLVHTYIPTRITTRLIIHRIATKD